MAPKDLAPGIVLGERYRLERRLGEGGMGVVWAAHELAGNARVAVKLIKDAAGDPSARRRFLHEGRAAAAVRHPNVVRILEVLELEDGAPAIVMELLEGESLRARLDRLGRLALGRLVDVMAAVISAAGAAHALGVIHRDLKPENIFLARMPAGDEVVKVLDFGIAKLTSLDGEAARSTGLTTGAVLGTPAYMAPEQVFGERDVDQRADLWAIGIVFYECASGVLPTRGDNVGQVLKNVLSRPFEPLDQLVPEVPPDLAALVARMLARERADRPADLREVLDLLAPHLSVEVPRFGPPVQTTQGAAPATAHPDSATRPARAFAGLTDTEPAPRPDRRPPIALDATAPGSPAAGRRSRMTARAVGGAAVIALAGAGWSVWRWAAPGAAPSRMVPASPAASPLAPLAARLACPVLRASGVDEPAGWLGAAAAATACERARVVLGGRPDRTLAPAELLDLPRGPAEAFPRDPYGQPGARDRTIAAARERAQAYLDGEVTWSTAGFTIALVLRRADTTVVAQAQGRSPALYAAVRAAMAPLIGPDRLPRVTALEPEIAAWARTPHVDDALAALDQTFAFVNNAGTLPDECQRFDARAGRLRELGPEGRWLCAITLGQGQPELALGDPDPSDAGRATRIRINFAAHSEARDDDVVFLRALFDREPTPRGRALAAGTEACVLPASRSQDARERAIVAVQSEPKNPEGGYCNPWELLMTLERSSIATDGAVRAMQAWVPWNSYAWLEPGFRAGAHDADALAQLWRAHVLSPLDAQIAGALAGDLLAAGDRAAARGVAATLRRGGLPIHDVGSELILVRVATSEARFGAAFAAALAQSELRAADTGWIRTQRFELGWRALEIAVLLGHPREIADALVARFLAPEPTVLDGNFALVPMRVPAICVFASTPGRCFARFRALRPQLAGAITKDTDDFLIGAERYVARDLAGAARAWRPLLGGRMVLASTLPHAMVEAFEQTGAIDLAEQVDTEVMRRAGELNGATLGHVRTALRALGDGDRAGARRLAEQVIRAWSVADELPPSLAEMRQLVAPRPAQ
jgi:eukaryotic-like serine/threonine-protein kinase